LQYPSIFIDGEVWFGRGKFREATQLTYGNSTRDAGILLQIGVGRILWELFRYLAFDCPDPLLAKDPFESRYGSMGEHFCRSQKAHPFVVLSPRIRCESENHKAGFMEMILLGEGEGIIARKYNSCYKPGRSYDLLKFKAMRDSDAKIIAIHGTEYTCLLPTGQSIITSVLAKIVQGSINISDIVSLKCIKYSKRGLLVRTAIYRVRHDVSWTDVLKSHNYKCPQGIKNDINANTSANVTQNQFNHRHGYWNNSANMRQFLDGFAKASAIDPCCYGDWCCVTRKDILRAGGRSLLYHYGSVTAAVVALYPELTDLSSPSKSVVKWKTSLAALQKKYT